MAVPVAEQGLQTRAKSSHLVEELEILLTIGLETRRAMTALDVPMVMLLKIPYLNSIAQVRALAGNSDLTAVLAHVAVWYVAAGVAAVQTSHRA